MSQKRPRGYSSPESYEWMEPAEKRLCTAKTWEEIARELEAARREFEECRGAIIRRGMDLFVEKKTVVFRVIKSEKFRTRTSNVPVSFHLDEDAAVAAMEAVRPKTRSTRKKYRVERGVSGNFPYPTRSQGLATMHPALKTYFDEERTLGKALWHTM